MTDPDIAPDFYDPSTECHAWRKVPSVIGGPVHSHVCREAPEHDGIHVCMCGAEFTSRGMG